MKIDEGKKQNNLNAVRLAAAVLVLYGHAHVFLGLPDPLFLSLISLGTLGVFIFFTISGYLIVESWYRDPNIVRYFTRRLLRIFPALAVCTILTVFVLGPMVTTKPIKEYFESPFLRIYLRNIVLYINYYLPGVFEKNPYPNAVNGSLWTLPVEFSMYILVSFVGLLRGNRWVWLVLALTSILITIFWAHQANEMLVVYATDLRQIFICGSYFWVGAVFYAFDVKRFFSITSVVVVLLIMLCMEANTSELRIALMVLLPFVVLGFGLSYSNCLNRVTRFGDYSYGIYIYAFPVQQTLVMLYPNIGIQAYICVSFLLTLLLAIPSWHLIEKRALALKPRRAVSALNQNLENNIDCSMGLRHYLS